MNLTTRSKPKIYSFAACNDLSEELMPGISIYNSYLSTAFADPKIRNIVVSGDLGIGKSSVIRTFERQYIEKVKGNGFLYISLGNYRAISNNDKAVKLSRKKLNYKRRIVISQNKKNDKEEKEQNAIERRLLMQIYSGFQKELIPASNFKLIPEHSEKKRRFIALFVGALFFSGMTAILHSRRVEWTEKWLTDVKNNAKVLEILSKPKMWDYYQWPWLIFFTLLTFGIGYTVYHFLPTIKAKTLSIKIDTLEASIERDSCESYFDQYVAETVYCLEQIAQKVNYTVVIEDIDRLKPKQCLEVFTRMREMNKLVNQRLANRDGSPYIRFVYVANDSILSYLQGSKFADYIMPIYSRMNEHTSEVLLCRNIEEINREVQSEYLEYIFRCKLNRPLDERLRALIVENIKDIDYRNNTKKSPKEQSTIIKHEIQKYHFHPSKENAVCISICALFCGFNLLPLHMVIRDVAGYVADYRRQSSILNDYSMLLRLNVQSEIDRIFSTTNCKTMNNLFSIAWNLLAFAVYKNIFPNDYARIREHHSKVFPKYCPNAFGKERNELLEKLCLSAKPSLSFDCLIYAGFSKDEIAEFIVEMIKEDPKNNMIKYEDEYVTKKTSGEVFYLALQKYLSWLITAKDVVCEGGKPPEEYSYVFECIAKHSMDYEWNFDQFINAEFHALSVIKIFSEACPPRKDEMRKTAKVIFNLIGCDDDKTTLDKFTGGIEELRAYSLDKYQFEILKLAHGSSYLNDKQINVDGQNMRIDGR